MQTCPDCGRALSSHDRHVRFTLPDPVLSHGIDVGSETFWMDGPEPARSDFIAVDGLGSFARALLPVRLTGGHTVTFGVWLGLSPEEMERAIDGWHSPEYADLRFEGRLANAIPPWDVLRAPVSVEVRDPAQVPYCSSSTDAALAMVLDDIWDHELVLSATPA
jgi:hypothetical protein